MYGLFEPLIMLKSISVYKLNQMGYDLRSFRLRLISRTLDQKLKERRQRYTHVYRTFSCHGWNKEVYKCVYKKKTHSVGDLKTYTQVT